MMTTSSGETAAQDPQTEQLRATLTRYRLLLVFVLSTLGGIGAVAVGAGVYFFPTILTIPVEHPEQLLAAGIVLLVGPSAAGPTLEFIKAFLSALS